MRGRRCRWKRPLPMPCVRPPLDLLTVKRNSFWWAGDGASLVHLPLSDVVDARLLPCPYKRHPSAPRHFCHAEVDGVEAYSKRSGSRVSGTAGAAHLQNGRSRACTELLEPLE